MGSVGESVVLVGVSCDWVGNETNNKEPVEMVAKAIAFKTFIIFLLIVLLVTGDALRYR